VHSVDAVLEALEGTVSGLEVRRVGEGGIELRTDAVMLTEIVRNLLLNARQAGASRAAVSVTRAGGGVDIAVDDDGPGIPLEDVSLLFEWFHTTRSQGTGLGLPVSRRLAEALGGTLELVMPRPATFRVHLPEVPASQDAP
jgi:signal transduction histidine kinase